MISLPNNSSQKLFNPFGFTHFNSNIFLDLLNNATYRHCDDFTSGKKE
ncbi:MAG: hypothetical protein UR67_C0002G0072 [candidate division CPR3 bacterium GW2011_GWF2_35_18]|uniref:Uncharacterized protein n=1 Tax=candidate division CPR3 bacterium GW2011_GWF2_35_18 TaxID=1618350 RepID=A0A0G0ERH6_UNCC3|nr:MAG: hypothetical protein UR67_C0002G0072 [candidate division CPR3 bacterium GW2011_GWF2_35_18]